MKINLENVNFNYSKFSIKDINLSFESGEIVSIVGNNASGKTTLLQIIAGFLKLKKGKVLVDGEPLKKSKAKLGVVFQNPDSQIIFNNVYDDICFTLKNFGIPKNEWEEKIDYALDCVGMSDYKNKEVFEMSAGQKQRIAIANMLAIDPDILIFDESSSYLDTSYKQAFYKLIMSLKEQGKIVILATNVLEEIVYSDRVVMLKNGELAFDKDTKEAIKHLELFVENGMYVPFKLKVMQKFNIDAKFDDEILSLLGEKL